MNWTSILEDVLPHPCFDRPFVCEGMPHQSNAVIIGENPATHIKTDWWTFWNDATGFDYNRFLDDYRKAKIDSNKSPEPKGARLRFNRFRQNGIKAIETNAYQNQRPDGAGRGVSNARLLRALIDNMPNLRAVIAHGKPAQQFIDAFEVPKHVEVFKTKHFRLIGYDCIDEICQAVLKP